MTTSRSERTRIAQDSRNERSSSLFVAFERVIESGLFDGSHTSLDRDRTGEMTVNIVPDWIEAKALRFLVNLAAELELALTLTENGLRLDEQTGEMVRRVQAVKDTLAAERESEDVDDD